MKKQEAINELNRITNSEVWFDYKPNIKDYVSNKEELISWCTSCDDGEMLTEDFDFGKCEIEFYGSDSDECDISAFIVFCGEDVISYGYTSD